jgi:hypothetical protein
MVDARDRRKGIVHAGRQGPRAIFTICPTMIRL